MVIISHGAAAVIAMTAYKRVSTPKNNLTFKTILTMYIFGILPDVPLTLLVLANKFDPAIHYHHKWITHTPVFWLVVSLLVMKLRSREAGWALLAGTWLHLGMDWYGGGDGIPYLYPVTDEQFGVALSGANGPKAFEVYFSQPLFVFLELLVQGTFLAIIISTLRKNSSQKKSQES